MSINVVKNTIIEFLPATAGGTSTKERVLWVDRTQDTVFIINIHDNSAIPTSRTYSDIALSIKTDTALIATSDPFAFLNGLPEVYKEKHALKTLKNLNVIKPLAKAEPDIYIPKTRGKLVREAMVVHGVTKMHIYVQLRRYWQRGFCDEALLPDYLWCGAPGFEKRCRNWNECGQNHICSSGKRCPFEKKRGRPSKKSKLSDESQCGVNVSAADKKIFSVAIKLYFCRDNEFPLKAAYYEMLNKHYAIGQKIEFGKAVPILAPQNEIPNFEQFRYWHDKTQNIKTEAKLKKGLRKMEMDIRPLLGNSTSMAFGPGSIFMIDATVGDITLVRQFDRKIIGRPIIYFIIDVFSRMIVGFHICLRGPSWEGSAMAIANAATSKVQLCARFGIQIEEIDWPCHHLPEAFIADRGEMISNASDSLVASLNITVANCSPYRPDLKGIVERYFKTTNDKVLHWLPGDTRTRDFGNPDNRLNATLDIKQLTKIIIHEIIEHNKKKWLEKYPLELDMIAAGVKPIPINLWHWGIQNRVGLLREESRESIICKLLPRSRATVTAHGVRSETGLHYSMAEAADLQWFERARSRGTWQVDMAFDPAFLDQAYLISQAGQITSCELLPRDERFRHLTTEELEEFNTSQDIGRDYHMGDQQQARSDTISHVDQIVAEAEAMTSQALQSESLRKSSQSRLKQVKNNRSAEVDLMQKETHLHDGIVPATKPATPAQPPILTPPEGHDSTGHLLKTIIASFRGANETKQ